MMPEAARWATGAVRRGLVAGRAAGPARFAGSWAGTSLALCCTTGHRRYGGRPPVPGVRRPDPASLCAPPAGRHRRRGPAGIEHGLDAVPQVGRRHAAGRHGARAQRAAPGYMRAAPGRPQQAWARRRPSAFQVERGPARRHRRAQRAAALRAAPGECTRSGDGHGGPVRWRSTRAMGC